MLVSAPSAAPTAPGGRASLACAQPLASRASTACRRLGHAATKQQAQRRHHQQRLTAAATGAGGTSGGAAAPRAAASEQQQQQQKSQREPEQPQQQAEEEAEPAGDQQQQQASQQQTWITPATLRKVTAVADANEALDVLCAELCGAGGDAAAAGAPPAAPRQLTEGQCRELLLACLDRGAAGLALSIFRAMSAAGAAAAAAPAAGPLLSLASLESGELGGGSAPLRWPPASVQTAAALVVGLARCLQTREAIALVNSVRARGLASTEDVNFGHVVACPQDSSKPLAVVQPQEGTKVVADAFSRYEYELFSGRVASAASESLVSDQNWLLAAARRVGLLKKPGVAAVHTLLVETPGGQQRTFRLGTATADVPAKVGDRITVVCTPQRPLFAQRRLLSAVPHGSKPGEALSVSNHTTRTEATCLRAPPPGGSTGGLPSWALPAAVVLSAGDAASSLIDPALPLIVAGAVIATVGTAVAGNNLLLPRLRQLPARAVEVQATRQRLLGQHTELEARIGELVDGSVEDVLTLARLWQLQNKMAAVGAGPGAYEARLDRVAAARAGVEARLAHRIELVDSYAKVIAMIEIEVEMDTDLPAAEVLGIEEQIARLSEIESLQEEWKLQAEAQDEVERLLRSQPI